MAFSLKGLAFSIKKEFVLSEIITGILGKEICCIRVFHELAIQFEQ